MAKLLFNTMKIISNDCVLMTINQLLMKAVTNVYYCEEANDY